MGSAIRNDFQQFLKRICEEILSRVHILPIGSDVVFI